MKDIWRNIYDLYHQWIIFILLEVRYFKLNVLLINLVNVVLVFLIIFKYLVDAELYKTFLFSFKSVFFCDFE